MAVWAGFWIAITFANGWPAIYAIAAGVSLGMFALAAGSSWVGRWREPEVDFSNTLQEEVRTARYGVILVVFAVWASYKDRDELRKAAPKLELRQRHLRELLAALDARELERPRRGRDL